MREGVERQGPVRAGWLETYRWENVNHSIFAEIRQILDPT